MHFRLLVSGLPRSLPPLPPYLPCIEGRQRAAPRSSSYPQMTAPLQTLHMDVWGPARVSGQGRERFFPLVVDDNTRYTTVFPLRNKGEAPHVLITWICAVRLQLRERFRQDLPVLRLHFYRGENGIAERRIGLVMEVARTSMIHTAGPHFLWPFAVRYAAHQLNLWPRVSLEETSPTLRWTGKVGDASVFRVWVSRAFVHDTSADKLSARFIPCVFLGFLTDAPGWQFYHPTSHRVFLSQDVTFDKPVPVYLSQVDPAPSGVSQVDPLPGNVPLEIAVGLGAAPCAASGGAEPGGAESEAAEFGASAFGVELQELESLPLVILELEVLDFLLELVVLAVLRLLVMEVLVPGVLELLGLVVLGVLELEELELKTLQSLEALEQVALENEEMELVTLEQLALELDALALVALALKELELETQGLLTLELEVLGLPSSSGLTPPLLCPPPDQSQPPLQPASPLPAPSPYTEKTGDPTEHRDPESCSASPIRAARTGRRIPRPRPPPADIFTKALPLGDHQRFSTVLGLVPTLPHLLTT
ncbi:unnamed protein product [Closterium sp. NIES-53]